MTADQVTDADRKTPEEWLTTSEFSPYEIVDPDGWDRFAPDWHTEWTRPLTRDEFARRLARCTIGPSRRAADQVTDAGKVMTTTEACLYAGYLSRSSLIRAITLGHLRTAGKEGHGWLLSQEDVDAYLNSLSTRGRSRGIPRPERRKQRDATA